MELFGTRRGSRTNAPTYRSSSKVGAVHLTLIYFGQSKPTGNQFALQAATTTTFATERITSIAKSVATHFLGSNQRVVYLSRAARKFTYVDLGGASEERAEDGEI